MFPGEYEKVGSGAQGNFSVITMTMRSRDVEGIGVQLVADGDPGDGTHGFLFRTHCVEYAHVGDHLLLCQHARRMKQTEDGKDVANSGHQGSHFSRRQGY